MSTPTEYIVQVVSSGNDSSVVVNLEDEISTISSTNTDTNLVEIAIQGPAGATYMFSVGDLKYNAYGIGKVSLDKSLFHGLFTFDVPDVMWIEQYNGTEVAKTNATSVDGMLNLTSNGGEAILSSRRHPRFQPGRGLLYATAIILPNPTADGIREFGLVNPGNGVFFRLKSDGMYAVRRHTTTAEGLVEVEEHITFPFDIDFSKGNIFAIQISGTVGTINFLAGDAETNNITIVHTMDLLGTLEHISITNPAMPIYYSAEYVTEDVLIKGCCVDVSVEGGEKESTQYGSVSTSTASGSIPISGYNTPVMAIRLPDTYNGMHNTRDIILNRVTGYSDNKSVISIWYTRDSSAITATWSDIGGGNIQFSENGDITAFDETKCYSVHRRRINRDTSEEIDNPNPENGEFILSHGDYLIVTLHRENGGNVNVGTTIEWGEEI